jgi:hypothetical protein
MEKNHAEIFDHFILSSLVRMFNDILVESSGASRRSLRNISFDALHFPSDRTRV